MSPRPDPTLEALLADQPVPPVPAGLVERTVAAATALPQEPRPYKARRAVAPRRDRRLRRPLLIGSAAIGLLVSSAVAGTLAGVPLPAKVEAVLAELPLVGRKKVEPAPAPPPRRAAPSPPKAEPIRQAEAEPTPPGAEEIKRAEAMRRLIVARRIVAERRRAGLPTPVADRLERAVAAERMRRWRQATPEEKALYLERREERRRARREARAEVREEMRKAMEADPSLSPREALREAVQRVRERREGNDEPVR